MLEGRMNRQPGNADWFGGVESWDDDTPLDADEIELPFYKEVELSGGKGSTVVLQTTGRKLRFGKYSLRKKNIDAASAARDGKRQHGARPPAAPWASTPAHAPSGMATCTPSTMTASCA